MLWATLSEEFDEPFAWPDALLDDWLMACWYDVANADVG